MPSRHEELKAFLRARRAALSPEAVGLPGGSRRKTPGLRREEVASIADIGVTWYTWLEQGRPIHVSRDSLERIAHALRLSASDTAYLLALAEEAGVSVATEREADADPMIQRVIESIDRAMAFVVDPYGYVVAFNALAERIYDFEGDGSRFSRNHLWRIFADPARRAFYEDSWDAAATSAVGLLRIGYASRIGTPAFEAVLTELRGTGAEFTRRWDAQRTASPAETLSMTLVPERIGRLAVHSTRLAFPARPDYVLVLQSPADDAAAAIFGRTPSRRPRG